jgi:hypothetical protein
MDGGELESVAKAWWAAVDAEDWDSAETLHDLLKADPEMFPSVIAVLVRTAPQTGPEYVGTSLLEDLHYEANYRGTSNKALDYLIRSGVDSEEINSVLSGVYPDMLEEWGLADRVAGRLTKEQIEWLTSPDAPDRRNFL